MIKLIIIVIAAILVALPISGLINWWIWKDYKLSIKEMLIRPRKFAND